MMKPREEHENAKYYNKIYINNQIYLRRKKLYKLQKRICVYIIDLKIDYDDTSMKSIKVCISSDITNRVADIRTSCPFCKVLMVMYTDHSDVLQKNIRVKYEDINNEFLTGVTINELKESLITFANLLGLEYTIENDEEIGKFNKHIIKEENDVKEL